MNDVRVRRVPTVAFSGQRPGTSGLRKKTRVFMQQHYLENFVQSVFNALFESTQEDVSRHLLVIGGDGRYYNRTAIQTILRIAAANGFGRIIVGRGGILSTPAMSAVIRRRSAIGGILLSASHNPGGIDADFGIKFNTRNGGPAPEAVTESIYAHTLKVGEYLTLETPDIELDRDANFMLGGSQISILDPLQDYTAVMRELFDFEALRGLFSHGFRLTFDAMHGVTGPYACHIFEECLGAKPGTVMHGVPLEDFGGHHPDPNMVHARELVDRMAAAAAPDLGAACDGDGDRNMILGPGCFVTPGDSLAIIAEHASSCIPGYHAGLVGVARSMPTSTAVDRVARALSIPCYETPTGWKFFGNLMDDGRCTLCGEESFGTGSNHIREKDGLWAVLSWLSILESTGQSVCQVIANHWKRFGRSYFQRHDFEGLDSNAASEMMEALRSKLSDLGGSRLAGSEIDHADDFSYTDPVDQSVSARQGIRILFKDGSRVVIRLSGTGTEGATLRLYLERYQTDGSMPVETVLQPMARAALDLLEIRRRCGRDTPDVVT